MAPEVLIDPPDDCNLKADVFTFGIVLWEMFSMEAPYSHIKRRDDLVEFVSEFPNNVCSCECFSSCFVPLVFSSLIILVLLFHSRARWAPYDQRTMAGTNQGGASLEL